MRRLAAVAAGGALGAGLRVLLAALPSPEPGTLPLVVLAGNLGGAFALGAAAPVLVQRFPRALALQAFVTTGVIGSFTTFSAVALDLVVLADAGAWAAAAAYAAVSVTGGVLAALGGLHLGRRWSRAWRSPA